MIEPQDPITRRSLNSSLRPGSPAVYDCDEKYLSAQLNVIDVEDDLPRHPGILITAVGEALDQGEKKMLIVLQSWAGGLQELIECHDRAAERRPR